MNGEVLSYKPILPANISFLDFQHPDLSLMRDLYKATGFPNTPQGESTQTAVLRGSTASLIPSDGTPTFRTDKSDVDVYAVTTYADFNGAGYHISNVRLPGQPKPREVDVLYFTPSRLLKEQQTSYRTYLTTKIVQPGWPIFDPDQHNTYKVRSCEEFILRAAARHNLEYLTPSGAARLILEEVLFAEPWRWSSFKTYFVESPNRDRQRGQLLYFADLALKTLVDKGMGIDISLAFKNFQEPVYKVVEYGGRSYNDLSNDRVRTVWNFVYDQLILVVFSRHGLSSDSFIRGMMKLRSFLTNPSMNYNCDIIFA